MKSKDLAANPQNPRKVSDAKLAQLQKSLREFGDISGVVFNRTTGNLVGGHQRNKNFDDNSEVKITKVFETPSKSGTVALGYILHEGERFAYREVRWPRHKEMAANIAANKGAGEWDLPQLGEWMRELGNFDSDFDIELTLFDQEERQNFGFDEITVQEHTRTGATGIDEDKLPLQAPARTKRGNIYQLGDHRLMCGDSTLGEEVATLIDGNPVDLCFTSPPYNLGKFEVSGPKATNPNRKEKYLTVKDDMTAEDYEEFLFNFIRICIENCTSTLVNIGLMESNKRPVMRVIHRLLDNFKETLYWRKSTSTPHIQPGIVTSLVEPIFCFGKHGSRQFKTATFRGNCPNVVDGSNASGNEFAKIHAATFPVYLPEWAITNFSQGSVYGPFGGTGSTLIACEKLSRECFMMELDPAYCDVIVERWEKYTGKTAKLLNGKTLLNREASGKSNK